MALISWQTGAKISKVVIIVVALGIIAWDILAIILTGAKLEASVSQSIWNMSLETPAIPYGFCLIVGHLFFGNPQSKSILMRNPVSRAIWGVSRHASFVPLIAGSLAGYFIEGVVGPAITGLVFGHLWWGNPDESLVWSIKNGDKPIP